MFDTLPTPSERNLAVRVTKDALRQIRAGHPWIFDQSITSVSGPGNPGDLAIVFDDKRKFAAIGLWDPTSAIRIRVLTTSQATINQDFWERRLAEAQERREPLPPEDVSNGIRLVHGENDALPGLVIDRYDTTMVIKLYSSAWFAHLQPLLSAVNTTWEPTSVVLRLARNVGSHAPSGFRDGSVLTTEPPPDPTAFLENGFQLTADPVAGQKTGYFLDQRRNRALVAEYAADRDVLDVFCCHGGFSVHAAAGGARHVHSTDLSPFAVASAKRHVATNIADASHSTTVGDAFEVMADLAAQGQRFDFLIVDPPSFASRKSAIESAARAYTKLTHLAVDLLRPGGLLLQASCSSRIDADLFANTVTSAIHHAGARHSLLKQTGHDFDHPIGYAHGAYLKAVLLEIN